MKAVPLESPPSQPGLAENMFLAGNPYLRARRLVRQRAPSQTGQLLTVVAAALATPLARPIFFGFLSGGELAAGVEAISLRFGLVVAAAMAMHTYADLVRGEDRPILDPHPVDSRALLVAIRIGTARQRAYLPVAAAVLLSPILFSGHWLAWLGAVGVVLGAWLGSLGVGFAVHLSAVWAGLSPGVARLMDLIRGDNPRMQAALLYAPGAAVGILGGGIGLAAAGVAGGLRGWTPGWLLLGAPLLIGVVGLVASGRLAERFYVRATALLTEIDGEYARKVGPASAEPVYLEWAAGKNIELRRQLRNGWRSHRLWAFGPYLLGLSTLFTVWSQTPGVSGRLLAVAGGGALLVAGLPFRLSRGDPAWLDLSLGISRKELAFARGSVGFLYAQGTILPGFVGLLRHGSLEVFTGMLGAELLLILACVLSGSLSVRKGEQGAWVYAALVIPLWAGVAGGTLENLVLGGVAP